MARKDKQLSPETIAKLQQLERYKANRLSPQETRRIEKGIKKEVKKEEKLQAKQQKNLQKSAKQYSGITKAYGAFVSLKRPNVKAERRALARRARGVQRLLGVNTGRKGRGRPSGTFKYGMPISEFKKLRSRQREIFEQYRLGQTQQLQSQGLTPQQINQLEFIKALQQSGRLPTPAPQVIDTPESVVKPVEDDLEFTKFRADKTISPQTQRILRQLRSIQLKGLKDDVEMQRRLKERRIFSKAASLLDTPYIFNRNVIDFTGVKTDNPLLAENIWAQAKSKNILHQDKPSVLQTKEGGNDLRFF